MSHLYVTILCWGIGFSALAFSPLGALGQEEELGGELPEKGVHPLYGPLEDDPIPVPPGSVPAAPQVELRERFQLMSELAGADVYSNREELLGNVEDVVVGLPEWRVDYLLVRPAIGIPIETGMWFAIAPEIVDVDPAAVLVDLPAANLLNAPAVSEEALMVLVEQGEPLVPVYRVRMLEVPPPVDDPDLIYGRRNLPPSLVDPEDPENPERLIDPEDLADREDLVDPEKVDPEKVDPEKMDPEKIDPLPDLAR